MAMVDGNVAQMLAVLLVFAVLALTVDTSVLREVVAGGGQGRSPWRAPPSQEQVDAVERQRQRAGIQYNSSAAREDQGAELAALWERETLPTLDLETEPDAPFPPFPPPPAQPPPEPTASRWFPPRTKVRATRRESLRLPTDTTIVTADAVTHIVEDPDAEWELARGDLVVLPADGGPYAVQLPSDFDVELPPSPPMPTQPPQPPQPPSAIARIRLQPPAAPRVPPAFPPPLPPPEAPPPTPPPLEPPLPACEPDPNAPDHTVPTGHVIVAADGAACTCTLTGRRPASFFNCTQAQASDDATPCLFVMTCPLPRQTRKCHPECEASGGVCNQHEGRCDCPPGMRVDPKTRECANAITACTLTPGFQLPCTHRETTCACIESCDAFFNTSYAEAGIAASPRPMPQPKCMIPNDQKWLDMEFAGLRNIDANYIQMRRSDEYTYRRMNQTWVSVEECEDGCNGRGTCSRLYGDPTRKVRRCECLPGFDGPTCAEAARSWCPNGCSGRGQCVRGWCRCKDGFYGTDCSLKEGAPAGGHDDRSDRKDAEPRIFVYDLPPWLNVYRVAHESTAESLASEVSANALYSLEVMLHHRMLSSSHRTMDPLAADFFFVPVYSTEAYNGTSRANHGITQAALDFIRTRYPYFNSTGGADHMWPFASASGACGAPLEIDAGIYLTPWGYTGESTEPPDRAPPWENNAGGAPCFRRGRDIVVPPAVNWSRLYPPVEDGAPAQFGPPGSPAVNVPFALRAGEVANETVLDMLRQYPLWARKSKYWTRVSDHCKPGRKGGEKRMQCVVKWASSRETGLLDGRSNLLMFAGCVHGCPGEEDAVAGESEGESEAYSLGVRQAFWKLFDSRRGSDRNRAMKMQVRYLSGPVWPQALQPAPTRLQLQLLYKSSLFCLAPPGPGWTHRLYTSIMYGCIPVVPHLEIAMPFEEIIPWARFAILSDANDAAYLPERLKEIKAGNLREMLEELACVWPRLTWSGSFGVVNGERAEDDAFSTLMLVLRARMLNGTAAAMEMQEGPFGAGEWVADARKNDKRVMHPDKAGIWRAFNGGCGLRLLDAEIPNFKAPYSPRRAGIRQGLSRTIRLLDKGATEENEEEGEAPTRRRRST